MNAKRKWFVIALALAGFVAVAGFRGAFGTGKTSPALQRHEILHQAEARGHNRGYNHGRNGRTKVADVLTLARDEGGPAAENGPDGDAVRAAFVRGYEAGFREGSEILRKDQRVR